MSLEAQSTLFDLGLRYRVALERSEDFLEDLRAQESLLKMRRSFLWGRGIYQPRERCRLVPFRITFQQTVLSQRGDADVALTTSRIENSNSNRSCGKCSGVSLTDEPVRVGESLL